MELSTHFKDSLVIKVEYNELENNVERILSVDAYCPKRRTCIDITDVFIEQLSGDDLIARMDWREIYYYQVNARESYV